MQRRGRACSGGLSLRSGRGFGVRPPARSVPVPVRSSGRPPARCARASPAPAGAPPAKSGRPAPGAVPAPAFYRVPVPPAGGPWSLRARCPGRGAPAPLRLGLCALRVGPGCAPRGPPSCASPPGPPRRGPARLRGASGGPPLRRAGPRFPAAPAGASGAAPPRGARRGSSAPGGRPRRRGLAAPWTACAAGACRRGRVPLRVRPAALWAGPGGQGDQQRSPRSGGSPLHQQAGAACWDD